MKTAIKDQTSEQLNPIDFLAESEIVISCHCKKLL